MMNIYFFKVFWKDIVVVYNKININFIMKNILKYFFIEFCILFYIFGLYVNF